MLGTVMLMCSVRAQAQDIVMAQAAGTSRNPMSAPMAMLMFQSGKWSVMVHGQLFLNRANDSGLRGREKTAAVHVHCGHESCTRCWCRTPVLATTVEGSTTGRGSELSGAGSGYDFAGDQIAIEQTSSAGSAATIPGELGCADARSIKRLKR